MENNNGGLVMPTSTKETTAWYVESADKLNDGNTNRLGSIDRPML